MMQVGFAKKSICPGGSMLMAGYDLRKTPSQGVLDEIFVRALLLKPSADEVFLFLCFDLLGVPLGFCERLRAHLVSQLPLTSERIWISATHTHAAPGAVFGRLEGDETYICLLLDAALSAARDALADAGPAKVSFGSGTAAGVASFRDGTRENSAYDMPLLRLCFERADKTIELIRFACHCTVLSEANILISRDLAGAAIDALGGKDILLLNGACGDLSTRYTRVGEGPEELRRIGAVLAEGVKSTDRRDISGEIQTIRAAGTDFALPSAETLSDEGKQKLIRAHEDRLAHCEDKAQLRESRSIIAVLSRPPRKREPERRVHIAAADLGIFCLIGLPFEVNARDGEALEARLGQIAGKPVYALCYTMGYDGYLPSGKPIGEDSCYQDIASPYAPASRAAVRANCESLIKKLLTEEKSE